MKDILLSIFKRLPIYLKTLLVLSLGLVIYGYACRALHLFFFWESMFIGWNGLIVSAGLICFHQLRFKLRKEVRIILKIIIGLLLFSLMIEGLIYFEWTTSDAHKSVMKQIHKNEELVNKLGEIKEVVFLPWGGASVSSGSKGEEGMASFQYIVKGMNAYDHVMIHSYTTRDQEEWTILEIEW